MKTLRHRLCGEEGYATPLALFFAVALTLTGGVAVDTANAFRVREILQSTAEAAAFTGAVRASEPRVGQTPAQTPNPKPQTPNHDI